MTKQIYDKGKVSVNSEKAFLQWRNALLSLLIVSLMSVSAFAQNTITGKVTDEKDGSEMPGVSVLLKGTNNGTQTDMNGMYKLSNVPAKGILVFSFIGKASQEVVVGNQGTINVKLADDNKLLTEVVVVGYGTQKKKDLTGSITAITSEDFAKGNISTPDQLINGKIAGVQIASNGGAPGSGGQIRIRGGSSLSASNDPLIVIDGVPLDNSNVSGAANPLSFINPNDIESFNVLKDASAAAIYGSRASNGVIIITTKKGSAKDKFSVNFSTLFSVGQKTKSVDVLSADEFRTAINTHGSAAQKALLGTANTNWQDQIYRTALSSDNNLSITGVVAKTPYRVSVGYTDQNGILKTSEMQRTTGSIGFTPMLFNNDLKIDVNFKISSTKSNFADEGAIGAAIGFDPTQPVYVDGSKYGGYFQWTNANGSLAALAPANPLATLNMKSDIGTLTRMIGNIQFDYKLKFLTGLHAVWNLGFDRSSTDGKKSTSNLLSATDFTNNGSTGYYTQSRNNFTDQFYLNYVKTLGSHSLNIMAGAENQGFVREDENGTNYGVSTVTPIHYYFKTDYSLLSYFGRVNYGFQDKYLATVTVRRDGSSRFAPENRWGTFPSAAVAWKINKEFGLDAFSDLKLRAGWGITGQQDISSGDYPYLNAYTPGQGLLYQFGNSFYNVLRPNAYDPNIKWEQTQSTNAGLDFALKKSRISGSVDVYQKKTTNLINQINVPAGSNFSNSITTNVGSLESKGVELTLNYTPVISNNFNWDLGFNFAYNERKITALTRVNDPSYLGVQVGGISGGVGNFIQIHSTGYAPSAFYVYQQVYNAAGKPVEGVYVDKNGDGSLTQSDLYRYKSPAPTFMMGFTSQMNYKAVSFGFVLRSNIGNYVYNNIQANSGSFISTTGAGNYIFNMSRSFLTTGFMTRNLLSDYYVQNASFLKMDNLNVGYDLNSLIKSKKITAKLSFIVQNVFIVTKYQGLDPEVSNVSVQSSTVGIDNQVYPRPRTYSLGLNLHF